MAVELAGWSGEHTHASREYQPQLSPTRDQMNKHSREVQLERRENAKVSVHFSLQLFHEENTEEIEMFFLFNVPKNSSTKWENPK